MSKIYTSCDMLVGKTPLLELTNIEKKFNLYAKILAKLEYFNPAGSVKDRVAKKMLDDAREKGLINNNSVIIEPTSGNTGIGLAAVSAHKGYKVILTMPDSMSAERRKLLSAFGAEIVLTEGAKGMQGAIDKAEELSKEYENSFIPSQFTNSANPEAHYNSTGPEIFEDMEGNVDFLVCGVGTGGTLSGIGKYLKEKNPNIKIIAVEPKDSPLLSGGKAGAHKLQGIGANFIPEILDRILIDEVIPVATEEAYESARSLGKTEGILVGISSGAALFAAKKIAQREENKGKRIAVILPDGGDRYLSTELF